MNSLVAACTLTLSCMFFASPGLACGASHSALAQETAFDGGPTDTVTLNESFLSEINRHRCENGLPALTYDKALEEASTYHSDWMKETQVFAHDSTVPGMEKPWDRAEHFGYEFSTVAENLALYPRYAFNDEGFYVNGECQFARAGGEVINPITYADFAKQVGIGWMNSPGHRDNILRDTVTQGAVGISIDYTAEHCGEIYVTMLYGKPSR